MYIPTWNPDPNPQLKIHATTPLTRPIKIAVTNILKYSGIKPIADRKDIARQPPIIYNIHSIN